MNTDLQKALKTLRDGGIILYPTDTIWGLGCDATNETAVKKLYDLKKREDAKSMLVLVDSEGMLDRTVKNIPEVAWQLIDTAEKPLTIIYDEPIGVAPSLLSEDGSLGIRITKEDFSRELCKRFGKPIVSTSANISGTPSPKNFSEVAEEIKDKADYVVEYRQQDKTPSLPSNIIKLSAGGLFKIIR